MTREQAAKAGRASRIYFSYAVVMMWVIVLLDAVWLHTSLLPLVALAVLYTIAAPWLVRSLNADLERRLDDTPRSTPDIGL